MSRIDKACPGDCSNCQLLQNGEVEMTSCILDQIFQRTQRNEKALSEILSTMGDLKKVKLASINRRESVKPKEDG